MKMDIFKRFAAFVIGALATFSCFGTDTVVGNISGRVLAPTGSGVGGIDVILYDLNFHQYTNRSQIDGGFAFTVPAGSWNFYIAPEQAPGLIVPTLVFNIYESTNIANVDAKLLAADATITGTINDPNGQRVAGVRVYAERIENGIVTYSLPLVATDSAGNFTLTASEGAWFVSVECGDLLSRSFDCAPSVSVETTSGSAVANFSLTTGPPPTIESPRVEFTWIGDTGFFEAVLVFTLRGAPGGYDIEAREDVPRFNYSWPDVDFVSIPIGSDTVQVRHYLNAYPSLPGAQFFKIRRRLAPN